MNKRWFVLLAGCLPVAIVGGLLAVRMPDSGAAEARRTAAAAPGVQDGERAATAVLPKGLVTLRVQLGSKPAPKDGKSATPTAPTTWDGQVAVTQGNLWQVVLWQDNPQDSVDGNKWKLATRHITPFTYEQRKKGHEAMPVADSALLVEMTGTSPNTKLAFQTAQGNFELTLGDVPLGASKSLLGGLVQVTQLPNATTILSAPSEDDSPAAVLGRDGKLYVAYVAFTHAKGIANRPRLDEEPKSLDFLETPTGGDQVLLLRLDGDKWTGPLPVTPPGQDVFRPAIAVDGSGRTWVFWTAKQGGAWNLFARALQGDQWSKQIQVTAGQGPDCFAAAATDSSGRVWVAWQGFRNSKFAIMAAQQQGDGFAAPRVMAEGPGNNWMPAIAASSNGQVAVA